MRFMKGLGIGDWIKCRLGQHRWVYEPGDDSVGMGDFWYCELEERWPYCDATPTAKQRDEFWTGMQL